MATLGVWTQLFTQTMSDFFADRAPRLGAALAFYATFSVVPLLIMSAAAASLFFPADTVEGHVNHELVEFVGESGAEGIEAMISAAAQAHRSGFASSIFGLVALVIGAMGVFMELKDSMNTVWGVQTKPELGFWGSILASVLAFVMVLVIALLLLVSMILTSILMALSQSITMPVSTVQLVDIAVSTIVTTLLFMFVFKYLPDVKIYWRDVWMGAFVTAILFAVGKHLVGYYLATLVDATAYGAMSSIIAFLLWMYYSFQIFLLGAEFTQVYAQFRGRRIEPSSHSQTLMNRYATAKQPLLDQATR